jgi:hypothetical protein
MGVVRMIPMHLRVATALANVTCSLDELSHILPLNKNLPDISRNFPQRQKEAMRPHVDKPREGRRVPGA